MKHLFNRGIEPQAPTLVLFHGTGGTERDLLPLAERISPKSSILSLRGNVSENGMSRFFRRLAEGVFDREDLIFRTQEVREFLEQAADEYSFDRSNLVAIGYSNGANMIGSLLFHYGDALKGAILHHPMVPLRGVELPNLAGIPVFIGAGVKDPLCPPAESEDLLQLLEQAGAEVSIHWGQGGHQLTDLEVEAAAAWYRHQFGE